MHAHAATSTLAAPPRKPSHPTRLGKYELLGIVGEGAMGTVYQGLDPLLQRSVAVKAIHPHLLHDDASELSVTERFRNEAQAAGRLSHPGIVPIYEYGEEDGSPFIAMEFVRGQPLSRYLAADALAEDDVLSVAVQLLEALHHAHELGVWHRDIKPGNLMVTADGCVKVTDFGIARLASTAIQPASPHTELLMGSPGYIAPERYAGAPPDRRVDIFSCGVLLYQLLTGVAPFVGSASEVMFQVMHRDPPPPSRAAGRGNPHFDAVVFKALARRPADRFGTAQELRDALLAVAMRPVSRRLKVAAPGPVRIGEPGTDPGQAEARTQPGPRPEPAAAAQGPAPVVVPARAHRPALAAFRTAHPPAALPGPQAERPRTDADPSMGWPVATLMAIEQALVETLGPMARVLVPRAAARCQDLPSLMRSLAAEGLSAREQQAFFVTVKRALDAGKARPKPLAPPVLDDVATRPGLQIDPLTVAGAQDLLSAHAGPIAALLVRRALARSQDREGFFLALAEETAGCVDRRGLHKALQRLP